MISLRHYLVAILGASLPSLVTAAAIPEPAEIQRRDIWQPQVGDSWQIVLKNAIKLSASATQTTPDVSIFTIDLFGTDASTITKLHSLNKKVICYFSAGTQEPWTPDTNQFQDSDVGPAMADWPDEKWLNIKSESVRNIMAARIALAQQKGCDGVDPDNLDGYSHDNGFQLSADDAVDYVNFLAAQASANGLAIGVKNALEILPRIAGSMQFAVNEACAKYQECGLYKSLLDSGKPVFHIEYPSGGIPAKGQAVNKACLPPNSNDVGLQMSTILKNTNLNGKVQFCNGLTATTPIS